MPKIAHKAIVDEEVIETELDQPVWTVGEYLDRTPVSMKVIPGGLPIAVAE